MSSYLLTAKKLKSFYPSKEFSWEAVGGDDPSYIGKKDGDRLNRKEGYEVIDFVNSYCSKKGLSKESQVKAVLHEVLEEIKGVMKDKIEEELDSRDF